jgi:hypothetical protein
LRLVTEEEAEDVAVAREPLKTFREGVVAVLFARDFNVAAEFLVHGVEGAVDTFEGVIEAGGEDAGFEAGGAEDGLLGEGHALDDEQFLGADGLVGGEETGVEESRSQGVEEADDGEVGGGEAMFAGVLGGAGLAGGSAGSGGAGGVGAVGGEFFDSSEEFVGKLRLGQFAK